ncbi:hypothetical protein CY35_12G037400 [Sphagnum magellanicum]|nr:hypothetical protein CY35_12G037400 [Sphagnum magellanicum]KAH9545221.1 hypothetical protein CY35_12G037400 [Sphagnum magellanicum]
MLIQGQCLCRALQTVMQFLLHWLLEGPPSTAAAALHCGPKIIYLGKPDGPTCHTGAETCYYTSALQLLQGGGAKPLLPTLLSLESTIAQRKAEEVTNLAAKPSWTKRLLENPKLLCSKIREEADELCQTLEASEGKARTASEMADVLYHAMVLLAAQDVKLEDVLATLRARFTQSGVEEKNSRLKQV